MKNQACRSKHSQSGSVLFIIFIAIALFAALSYVFMQSSRSSGSVSDEKSRLTASEIVEYANAVKSGVRTLLINGCKDTQLSFANPVFLLNNGTASSPASFYTLAPTDGSCDVFGVKGANLRPVITTEAQIPQPHTGGARTGNIIFMVAAISGVGTAEPELLLVVPHINQGTCKALNKMLNVNNGNALYNTWPAVTYANAYPASTVFGASFDAIQGACFTNAIPEDPLMLHYYHVLIAR